MASTMPNFLVRFRRFWQSGLHYWQDGTFSEVSQLRKAKDNESDDRLWIKDNNNYRTLKEVSVNTPKISYYRSIVKDPEEWRTFERDNINHYFDDKIDLFPFNDGTGSRGDERTSDNRFLAPDRFFRVQQKMIDRRFPEGRNRSPGDADLRDKVDALRYIFSKNYWDFVIKRRHTALVWSVSGVLALIGFLAGIAIAGPLIRALGLPLYISYAASTGVLAGILWIILRFLVWDRVIEYLHNSKSYYESAMKSSCGIIGRNLQVRQNGIIAIIPLIFTEAENDKFVMKSEGKLDKWPEEVRKWTKLVFWMAGRVEYNDLAVQLQMWRIRRLHFGMRWHATLRTGIMRIGAATIHLLIFCCFMSVVWRFKSAIQADPIVWWSMIAAAAAAIAYTAWRIDRTISATATEHRVELDMVRNSLITDNIQGHKDVGLHEQIAELLFREKSALLYEEDKARR